MQSFTYSLSLAGNAQVRPTFWSHPACGLTRFFSGIHPGATKKAWPTSATITRPTPNRPCRPSTVPLQKASLQSRPILVSHKVLIAPLPARRSEDLAFVRREAPDLGEEGARAVRQGSGTPWTNPRRSTVRRRLHTATVKSVLITSLWSIGINGVRPPHRPTARRSANPANAPTGAALPRVARSAGPALALEVPRPVAQPEVAEVDVDGAEEVGEGPRARARRRRIWTKSSRRSCRSLEGSRLRTSRWRDEPHGCCMPCCIVLRSSNRACRAGRARWYVWAPPSRSAMISLESS